MSSPGDVLGVESCIDLRANNDNTNYHHHHHRHHHHFTASSSRCKNQSYRCNIASGTVVIGNSGFGHRSFTPAKAMNYDYREYPPPLPSLGVEMRRYCTDDGRLIIREEKTTRPLHDVFRADRSNGRLTLHFLRGDCRNQNDGVLDVDDDGVFQMDDAES